MYNYDKIQLNSKLEYNFALCVSSNFLICVPSELLGAKTESLKPNKF